MPAPRRLEQATLLSRDERVHLAGMLQRRALQERFDARATSRESESTSGVGLDAGSESHDPPAKDPASLVAADHAVTPQPGRGDPLGGRDPRLGSYRNVGTFLHHCWRRLGYSRADVYAVAGLASYEKPESLLLYTGGLPALYAACEAEKKARAA